MGSAQGSDMGSFGIGSSPALQPNAAHLASVVITHLNSACLLGVSHNAKYPRFTTFAWRIGVIRCSCRRLSDPRLPSCLPRELDKPEPPDVKTRLANIPPAVLDP